MKKIFILVSLVIFTVSTFASVDDSLMQRGNTAYQQENYAEAIDCYTEIVNHGNEGAILYYNLGNACFKNKENAQALLWYERALRLDPSNEDIKHNIAFVNLQVTDKIDALPKLFFVRWWNGLSQSMTVTGWAILAVVFGAVFALSVALMLVSRRQGTKIVAVGVLFLSILMAVLSLVFASYESKRYINHPEAIVIQSVVNAKGTPNENAASLFVIHEGLKVELTDRVGAWVEIKLPNGEKGWVEAESVEVI